MAEHLNDVEQFVRNLRHIAASVENLGKACQDICRVQKDTLMRVQAMMERSGASGTVETLTELDFGGGRKTRNL